MIELKQIILETSASELEHIISPFIEEQFPNFIKSDHKKLVYFIKAYYEWMEKKNNPNYVISKISTVFDVNNNLEEFFSNFKNTYMESFPIQFAKNTDGESPNKITLLKKIKEFYGNKGTESAYRFLFNIFYDSDVDFYYPKTDILVASAGKWVEPRSIKTTSASQSIDFKNGTLIQYTTPEKLVVSATAFIEDVVRYHQNSVLITEYFISSIVGDFVANSPVYIKKENIESVESIYSVLGGFFIELPGNGYAVGDKLFIVSDGVGFVGEVSVTGLGGSIKKISIINSGLNYLDSVYALVINSSGISSVAKILLTASAITKYPGYFDGDDGKLSSNKRIQDGHYYQQFSYELKSKISFDKYFNVLKDITHPAGLRLFGSILVNSQSSETKIGSLVFVKQNKTPIIGEYSPYTCNTSINLRSNGVTVAGNWLGATGDLYPLGYNPYISSAETVINGISSPLGTTFIGTSLGYTYAIVPENGVTSHNPLTRPLGSSASWIVGQENQYNISSLFGLTLWLKPEGIRGITGAGISGASGASMGRWIDASPSQNDGVLPTWDRWNPVLLTAERVSSTGWNASVWHPDPVDVVEWRLGIYGPPVSGVDYAYDPSVLQIGGFWCGSLGVSGGTGSGSEGATWAENALGNNTGNLGYFKLDAAWYPHTNSYSTGHPVIVSFAYGASAGVTLTHIATVPSGITAFSQKTVWGICYNPETRYINMYIDGVVYRKQGQYPQGTTFSYENVMYGKKSQLEILKASYGGVTVSAAGWTCSVGVGITFFTPYGATIEGLAPTITPGENGVRFKNSAMYTGLSTITDGLTLGVNSSIGATTPVLFSEIPEVRFIRGGTADHILKGSHFYLTKGITLTEDMDCFIVYKTNSVSYSSGLGFVGSKTTHHTSASHDEYVLYNRSYNATDINPALITDVTYYTTPIVSRISGATALAYPSQAGLAGFRIGGKYIAYDPHVSDTGITSIGEWTRDSGNVVESFYNGDASRNYSPSTGRRISTYNGLSIQYQGFTASDPVVLGRFGAYFRSSTLNGGRNWLYDALSYAGDGGACASQSLNTPGATLEQFKYNNKLTYAMMTGTYGNAYLEANNNFAGGQYATSWTFSVYVGNCAGVGGTLPNNPGVYIYAPSGASYPGVTSFVKNYRGHTFMKIVASSPVGANSNVTLVGINGLCAGATYYFSDALLEKGSVHQPVGSTAWASGVSQIAPYGFDGDIHEVLIFTRKLKESERQVVYGYLSSIYNLSNTLPSDFTLSRPSSGRAGTTFWEIQPHPKLSFYFGDITLGEFLNTSSGYYYDTTETDNTPIYDGLTLSALQNSQWY